jgi:hypothetical protein
MRNTFGVGEWVEECACAGLALHIWHAGVNVHQFLQFTRTHARTHARKRKHRHTHTQTYNKVEFARREARVQHAQPLLM